jgi:hypothetical protein
MIAYRATPCCFVQLFLLCHCRMVVMHVLGGSVGGQSIQFIDGRVVDRCFGRNGRQCSNQQCFLSPYDENSCAHERA